MPSCRQLCSYECEAATMPKYSVHLDTPIRVIIRYPRAVCERAYRHHASLISGVTWPTSISFMMHQIDRVAITSSQKAQIDGLITFEISVVAFVVLAVQWTFVSYHSSMGVIDRSRTSKAHCTHAVILP